MPRIKKELINYFIKDYIDGEKIVNLSKRYNISQQGCREVLIRYGVYESGKYFNTYYHHFDVIDSEVVAYIYGYLWADGYIQRNNTLGIGVNSDDVYILNLIKQYIGGSINNYSRYDKRTDKTYNNSTICLHSRRIVDNVRKLGFRDNIDFIPKQYYRHFLRGYFDGDGCIYVNEKNYLFQITLAGSYEENWNHITGLGIIPKYNIKRRIQKKSKSSVLIIEGTTKSKIDFMNYLYNDSTCYLERKFNKIKEYEKIISNRR